MITLPLALGYTLAVLLIGAAVGGGLTLWALAGIAAAKAQKEAHRD